MGLAIKSCTQQFEVNPHSLWIKRVDQEKLSTSYPQNVDNSVSNFIKLFLDDGVHGEYNGMMF